MTDTCIFCKPGSLSDIIFENEFMFVKVDGFPVSPGHVLVIPKRHIAGFGELTQSELTSFFQTVKYSIGLISSLDKVDLYQKILNETANEKSKTFIQKALDSKFINTDPDGYNYGINEGIAAGQTIMHLHFHIIPRYKDDSTNPTGGVRSVIPGMGDYK